MEKDGTSQSSQAPLPQEAGLPACLYLRSPGPGPACQACPRQSHSQVQAWPLRWDYGALPRSASGGGALWNPGSQPSELTAELQVWPCVTPFLERSGRGARFLVFNCKGMALESPETRQAERMGKVGPESPTQVLTSWTRVNQGCVLVLSG